VESSDAAAARIGRPELDDCEEGRIFFRRKPTTEEIPNILGYPMMFVARDSAQGASE
jgi:hypothetical protein